MESEACGAYDPQHPLCSMCTSSTSASAVGLRLLMPSGAAFLYVPSAEATWVDSGEALQVSRS